MIAMLKCCTCNCTYRSHVTYYATAFATKLAGNHACMQAVCNLPWQQSRSGLLQACCNWKLTLAARLLHACCNRRLQQDCMQAGLQTCCNRGLQGPCCKRATSVLQPSLARRLQQASCNIACRPFADLLAASACNKRLSRGLQSGPTFRRWVQMPGEQLVAAQLA